MFKGRKAETRNLWPMVKGVTGEEEAASAEPKGGAVKEKVRRT